MVEASSLAPRRSDTPEAYLRSGRSPRAAANTQRDAADAMRKCKTVGLHCTPWATALWAVFWRCDCPPENSKGLIPGSGQFSA
eukprot:5722325-Alexandrium_andersonii.AAC.1